MSGYRSYKGRNPGCLWQAAAIVVIVIVTFIILAGMNRRDEEDARRYAEAALTPMVRELPESVYAELRELGE